MIGERYIKPVVAAGALVFGGLAVSTCVSENQTDNAVEPTSTAVIRQDGEHPDWDNALVYAPEPLTAEQAIEHYVGMSAVRTSEAIDAEVSADLVVAFEDQYGLDADETFPGDPETGSQWIRLDLSEKQG